MIDRVHHVGVIVRSADAALGFYRDVLGLPVTADEVIEEQGVRGVLLALGENEIELLEPVRADTGVARYLASRGETLHHICLNTADIDGELARLNGQGVQLIDQAARKGLAGRVAFIHPSAMHGVLIELAQPPAGAHVSKQKGFDHLAVSVKSLEAAAQTWGAVTGLRVTNEVRPPGRGLVIGQMPCGQCTIELLAPTSADSPLAKRVEEQGERASAMVAIQVDDIEREIARYRRAGLQLPDATPGALPHSVTSSIAAEQGHGLAIQLIQFRG
ncbi:MAG: methylmalonyl-CoA epimerase [Dehalococcoidia bacterium]|nr:methylmalonyl-CoA epimerase [Dehalococcoidia bacterium]